MLNRFKRIGVRAASKKRARFIANPSYLRKLRTEIDGSCCRGCRNRDFYKVGWKKMRKTQFREERLQFNIGDYVFFRPFVYEEIIYPCVVSNMFGEIIRGNFALNFNLKRLDENETLFTSEIELLDVMPEGEAMIWKLKS